MNKIILLVALFSVVGFTQVTSWWPNNPTAGMIDEGSCACGNTWGGIVGVGISPATSVVASATQDSLIITYNHADADSIWDTYIMLGNRHVLTASTNHVCWDSTNVRGALRYAVAIDDVEDRSGISMRGDYYSIKVRIKGEDAVCISVWSAGDTVNIPESITPDTTAPNPVTNFLATGYNVIAVPKTYVNISATASASTDINYTRVMKDSGNAYVSGDSIGVFTTGTYQDTLPGANEVWSYKFEVVDDSGNVSWVNPTDSAKVPNTSTLSNPDAPILAAIGDILAIHLTVDTTGCKVTGGGTIDSIKFYKGGTLIKTQTALAYTDTPLSNNTSYSHYAKVLDSNGKLSAASNTTTTSTSDTTTFAFTKHYVDKDATGANNGTSWTNAWESFADISWGVLEPGDIVYISGGTDSTVYNEQLYLTNSVPDGTAEHPITFRNSWETGHNGRVIIDGSGRRSSIYVYAGANGQTINYYTFYGLELRDGQSALYLHWGAGGITLDSCYVYDWTGFGVQCEANLPSYVFDFTIQNCDIIGAVTYGVDCIMLDNAENVIVRNNFIRGRNNQYVNTHLDGIAAMFVTGMRIYNNICILDSNVQGQAYIIRPLARSSTQDSIIVYNNLWYQGGTWNSNQYNWTSVYYGHWAAATGYVQPPIYSAHNTIISDGPYVAAIWFLTPPTFTNNIAVQFGSGTGSNQIESNEWLAVMRNSTSIHLDSLKNNLFWREWANVNPHNLFNGNANSFVGPDASFSAGNWTTWTNAGGTGVSANPLFAVDIDTLHNDAQALLTGELKYNSPAINAGQDIQDIVENRLGLDWVDIGEHIEGRLGITTGNARASESDSVTIGAYNPPWRR